LSGRIVAETHELVDLGNGHLQISAVSQVTVSADDALNATSIIGLTVESLLYRLNSKVCVAAVCNFPKSNLRISCEIYILLVYTCA
jgi:hypothetical protein